MAKKMDRHLISSQSWEIAYIRLHFYKFMDAFTIINHPSIELIKTLKVACNNSRVKVYRELRLRGFKKA
jgi:hypothetical protein